MTDDEVERADINAIVGDLEELFSITDYEDDDGDNIPQYERSITIDFPPESHAHPGAQSITVPIRDILSWYAQHGPADDRIRVIEVRDLFYSGDMEEDYSIGLMKTDGLVTTEERHLVRWELEQGKAERARRKAEFDEEDRQYRLSEAGKERRWEPFIAERAAIDAEREAQYERGEVLDEEWYDFVHGLKTDKSVTNQWISQRRAELQAKTDQLIADNMKTDEVYFALAERVLTDE
jgi:hypothetical protein